MDWLERNLITSSQQHIDLFVQTEKDYHGVIFAANNKTSITSPSASLSSTSLRSAVLCMEKHMRLIHVTGEDNIM